MNISDTGERDMYSGDRHPLASEFWLLLLQEMTNLNVFAHVSLHFEHNNIDIFSILIFSSLMSNVSIDSKQSEGIAATSTMLECFWIWGRLSWSKIDCMIC